LLEVLVAVAVAGIVMVALLRSFVSTWYGIAAVREEAESMMIARTLIASVTPRENTTEVTQQGSIGRYTWAIEVKKAPPPPPMMTPAVTGQSGFSLNPNSGSNSGSGSSSNSSSKSNSSSNSNSDSDSDADSKSDTESAQPFSWTLYRIGVVVTASNGRRTTLETTRLARP
jgi:hypothetical protein